MYDTAILHLTQLTEAQGAIAFDAASSSGYEAALSSYNWNHTCTGTNRGLLVNISIFVSGTVTALTYNGVAMTLVRSDTNGVYRNEIWRLENPASGTNSIAVTLSGSLTSIGSAVSYSGVDQTNMIEANAGANGSNSTPTQSVTTLTDNAWVTSGLSSANTSETSTSPQTSRANNTGALGTGAMGDQGPVAPAAATTAAWSATGVAQSWALSVVAIKPYIPAAGTAWTVNVNDTVTTTDAVAKNVGKNPADGVTDTDAVSKAVGKNVADTSTTTDATAKNVGKNISDTSTTTDALAKSVGKNPSDSVTTTDSTAKSVGKNVADTVTDTDAVAKTFGKNVAATVSTADAVAKSIGKNINDAVATLDAVAKAVGRNIADIVTTTDIAAKTFYKVLTDTVATSDAVSELLAAAIILNIILDDSDNGSGTTVIDSDGASSTIILDTDDAGSSSIILDDNLIE